MNLDNLKRKFYRKLFDITYYWKQKFYRKLFDITYYLKQKFYRGLSNLDTFRLKKGIRETFWMFYFIPSMACLGTALILMVLHIDWYFLVPTVLLVGYALQNMLFFMKYGKRKKNFHSGSE